MKAKGQKVVQWSELTKDFNKSFQIKDDIIKDDMKHNDKHKIPNFFDYNIDLKQQENKKRVFRLIGKDKSLSSFQQRAFQENNNFHQKCSNKRKSKILNNRKTNREQYFKNIKKEIIINNDNNDKKNNNDNMNILQHEDFNDDDIDNKSNQIRATNTKKQNIDFIKKKKLNNIRDKLLKKQKSVRSTKITTKKELKQFQNRLESKNKKSGSHFCDDWNNNNLLSLHHNGKKINMNDFIDKEKGIDITEMKIIDVEYDDKLKKFIEIKGDNNNINNDECDLYEYDSNADPDEVIAAMKLSQEMRNSVEKEQEKEEQQEEELKNDGDDGDDKLDLEWKLEKIKNKHLSKHFDKKYEGPSFGINHKSLESVNARIIQLEHDDLEEIQTHFENLVNDEEELERDDENYPDNLYPDEDEFTDYNNNDNYNDDCDYNDDYGYNDDGDDEYYNFYDQTTETRDNGSSCYTNNYDKNSLGIDFFKEYDFN